MKLNTKVIHGGQKHEQSTGAVMPPIFQTSTFAQQSPGVHKGYEYARGENPTREALEAALASIENGKFGFAFSSGLAAIDAALKLLNPGDEVIAIDDLYGGTFRMFTKIYQKYKIKFHFVDLSNPDLIQEYLNEKTKLVWIETPTNPLMKIADIQKIAKNVNNTCWIAVDNTFASPALQNPLDLGADIVMHSATKYLGGHSDLVAGALIVNEDGLADQIKFNQFAAGGILGPQDSFLVLRGIKTLALRLQRHSENGIQIAKFLQNHDLVDKVYYPGLEDHAGHEVAKKQMRDFGGMVSFTLRSGKKSDAFTVLENFEVFTLAESLGGVESLANHPAVMTHASVPVEKRTELGITDDLIRLSVGIEDIEDLLVDLKNALDKI